MHFRHISAKIQPKNLKIIYYQFLAVRGNIDHGYALAFWKLRLKQSVKDFDLDVYLS